MKTATITILVFSLCFLGFCYGACNYDSCSECIVVSGCGWCFETDSCVEGTSNGPTGDTCSSYSYSSCSEPTGCAAETTCSDCTDVSGCGWCTSTQQCMQGGSDGPSSGSCSSWDWAGDNCAETQCEVLATCDVCTDQPSCGWCHDSQTCQTGNVTGPYNDACNSTYWDTSGNQCYAGCQTWTDCETCTSTGGCGWCVNNATCMEGDKDGDYGGRCGASWDYYGDTCPVSGENVFCVSIDGSSTYCSDLPDYTCSETNAPIIAATFYTQANFNSTVNQLVSILCPLQPRLVTSVYTKDAYCAVDSCAEQNDCNETFFLLALPMCWSLCVKCHTTQECNNMVLDGYVTSQSSNQKCADSFSDYYGSNDSSQPGISIAWLLIFVLLTTF